MSDPATAAVRRDARWELAGHTDPGRVRSHNEDALLLEALQGGGALVLGHRQDRGNIFRQLASHQRTRAAGYADAELAQDVRAIRELLR